MAAAYVFCHVPADPLDVAVEEVLATRPRAVQSKFLLLPSSTVTLFQVIGSTADTIAHGHQARQAVLNAIAAEMHSNDVLRHQQYQEAVEFMQAGYRFHVQLAPSSAKHMELYAKVFALPVWMLCYVRLSWHARGVLHEAPHETLVTFNAITTTSPERVYTRDLNGLELMDMLIENQDSARGLLPTPGF